MKITIDGTDDVDLLSGTSRLVMKRRLVGYLSVAWLLAYPPLALAYIGPGLGSGAVVAVLGVVFGLLMLVVGVVWYPIKRMIRRLRSKK